MQQANTNNETTGVNKDLVSNISSMPMKMQGHLEAKIGSGSLEVNKELIVNVSTNKIDANEDSSVNISGSSMMEVYEGQDVMLTLVIESYPPIMNQSWTTPTKVKNNNNMVYQETYTANGYRLACWELQASIMRPLPQIRQRTATPTIPLLGLFIVDVMVVLYILRFVKLQQPDLFVKVVLLVMVSGPAALRIVMPLLMLFIKVVLWVLRWCLSWLRSEASLLLRRVRQEDRGQYSFHFSNSFFSGSHNIDLQIYCEKLWIVYFSHLLFLLIFFTHFHLFLNTVIFPFVLVMITQSIYSGNL